MPKDHKYLVLAQDRRCYTEWCEGKDLNPYGPDVKYVTSSHHMRGYRAEDITIFMVCDWAANLTHTGTDEIMRLARMYEAEGATLAEDVCK